MSQKFILIRSSCSDTALSINIPATGVTKEVFVALSFSANKSFGWLVGLVCFLKERKLPVNASKCHFSFLVDGQFKIIKGQI